MDVCLRTMTDDDYVAFDRRTRRAHAEQIAATWRVPGDAARARADQAVDQALPAGRRTDRQLFLVAVDGAGRTVGHVWVSLPAPYDGATAWVADLWVDQALRGRGYGRAIMEEVERELAARGVAHVGLDVFVYNAAAVELYRSLGYQVSAMRMTKALGAPPAGRSDEPGE